MKIQVIKPGMPITFRFTGEQLMAAPLKPGKYNFRITRYNIGVTELGMEYIIVTSDIEGRRVITEFFGDKKTHSKDKYFYKRFLQSLSGVGIKECASLFENPIKNPPSYFVGRTGEAKLRVRGKQSSNYVRLWGPNVVFENIVKSDY